MHFQKSLSRFLTHISLTGVALLTTSSALARPELPGQLQEVANMQCVPLCTMCHATNPGVQSNWVPTKTLAALLSSEITQQQDIKPKYDSWKAMNPALAALVQKGIEPSTMVDVCGPTYGCAIRVEKEAAAPRDFTGPLWVVGAIVAGGLLRRRRKPSAS